ncbi:PREDICTED: uncharacterized protein C7orf61 homolog isoform X1 [Miniopterus natalensis]|uniref:uncharacterized protein C7orf61 homolog isoform X1 n=1 Tax=Miniopterus natalensis TaxID=291302 RepID=UPI0007A6E364|nr:PREDICTED: uncharacterized protein C7orf61 homolog isoform X1 [Miniopterus natalensis]
MEKAPSVVETFKLVEPPKEAKASKMEVLLKVADPCVLAKTADGSKVEPGRGGRSLLQLPQTAVKSVSTLMVSALQSGWQMCSWKSQKGTRGKAGRPTGGVAVDAERGGYSGLGERHQSSVSSTSVPSEIRTGSPLQSPEAEMLREVYLVLWAIRKQLRQLARRHERRRRRHICAHTSPKPEPVQGLKQDARSPL